MAKLKVLNLNRFLANQWVIVKVNIYASTKSFFSTKNTNNGDIGIFEGGILFPMSFKFEENSDVLAIFLPGAFDRKKQMPKFQRAGLFDRLPYNCLSLFDPTLFLSDDEEFSIGWFQGTAVDFYLDLLSGIVLEFLEKLGIPGSRVFIYSSSAGGIPAINLAAKVENSTCFCSNIQTNLIEYFAPAVERLLRISYGGASRDKALDLYFDRVCIHNINANFHLIYVQNISDSFHYKRHYLRYKELWPKLDKMKTSGLIYKNEGLGHNPLSSDKEIQILKSIVEKADFSSSYFGEIVETF